MSRIYFPNLICISRKQRVTCIGEVALLGFILLLEVYSVDLCFLSLLTSENKEMFPRRNRRVTCIDEVASRRKPRLPPVSPAACCQMDHETSQNFSTIWTSLCLTTPTKTAVTGQSILLQYMFLCLLKYLMLHLFRVNSTFDPGWTSH